ncbi:Hsp70 family protein [Rhodopirellula sp. MGV]|uniref:Hsp70 family protein n=1 Tax=Rhodopirellula sp. MGV TaxID=2023130 RepID=UPI000B978321|nr:Hsp70 family protein [Rhodopirellula sp. MGV]OYP39124.1 molecular chaperone DnaK [Rhodopirellula sp. MGV]PNY35498.1 Hsp70 family protein [Rhodopirellula baltica]
MTARFCIGIDLGTTNSVVAFAEISDDKRVQPELKLLPIPQLIAPGQVETRLSLPSFLYLPREGEVASLEMPLNTEPQTGIAGYYARQQSAENPQRVVVAAKSWLCHGSVGRTEPVLPWQSPPEVPKVSAFDCTTKFLKHLVAAWDDSHADAPLKSQQVVLTVPASFDPAARELTRQAAIEAGLPDHFVLLEEPQAAVYSWLASRADDWRDQLSSGDLLMVVDVGGGTTDLTLVAVQEDGGELSLQRLAVGNHLLLGGDNMDLALAHQVSTDLQTQGHSLDPWQSVSLWHACRDAKESLLSADGPDEKTISVLGRGSSLIGGTISTPLTADRIRDVIVEGFFPLCSAADRPQRQAASGFQDIGLPYEADPAITKQVAAFLADQADTIRQANPDAPEGFVGPTHLLFNGGVFRGEALRQRMQQAVSDWCETEPEVLGGREELDSAVALGAAYYGWSKQSGGIRIRGGTAKSYYIGIETAGLAIPGAPRPLRALCVAPQGMEEGTESEVPSNEVGLIVGAPARFRFFASAKRTDDTVGTHLDRWQPDELVESEPIELTLPRQSGENEKSDDPFVPVRFVSRVTELGMFELWCHATRTDEQWKMEFNVRDQKDR